MEKLKRHKTKILAILLICLVTAAEGILGARFFHGEMNRQIDENLKARVFDTSKIGIALKSLERLIFFVFFLELYIAIYRIVL